MTADVGTAPRAVISEANTNGAAKSNRFRQITSVSAHQPPYSKSNLYLKKLEKPANEAWSVY